MLEAEDSYVPMKLLISMIHFLVKCEDERNLEILGAAGDGEGTRDTLKPDVKTQTSHMTL